MSTKNYNLLQFTPKTVEKEPVHAYRYIVHLHELMLNTYTGRNHYKNIYRVLEQREPITWSQVAVMSDLDLKERWNKIGKTFFRKTEEILQCDFSKLKKSSWSDSF